MIEIGIVVIGVFTGTQISNWNADRLERIETRRMLTQLQPQLRGLISFSTSTSDYYKISRRYAAIALAGWKRDPKVDDRAFVIAAYQASSSWSSPGLSAKPSCTFRCPSPFAYPQRASAPQDPRLLAPRRRN